LDLDSRSKIKLAYTCLKGRILTGKKPEIFKTRHGYHVIWHGIPIDKETCLRWRKLLGDDKVRLRLDSEGNRISQVLFSTKKIKFYDYDAYGNKFLKKEETFVRQKVR
jgi:hypothetical protein